MKKEITNEAFLDFQIQEMRFEELNKEFKKFLIDYEKTSLIKKIIFCFQYREKAKYYLKEGETIKEWVKNFKLKYGIE